MYSSLLIKSYFTGLKRQGQMDRESKPFRNYSRPLQLSFYSETYIAGIYF